MRSAESIDGQLSGVSFYLRFHPFRATDHASRRLSHDQELMCKHTHKMDKTLPRTFEIDRRCDIDTRRQRRNIKSGTVSFH